MAKVDYSGVPEAGSKWELDGMAVIVYGFRRKGRGGYVEWSDGFNGGEVTWSEWKKRAKAA